MEDERTSKQLTIEEQDKILRNLLTRVDDKAVVEVPNFDNTKEFIEWVRKL